MPGLEIVNNPATNLPLVPEGYYWKVDRTDEMYYNETMVRLMKELYRRNGKRKRHDECVESLPVESPYLDDSWEFKIDITKSPEENAAAYEEHMRTGIQQQAEKIMERQHKALVRESLIKSREKFYGNYPPKSL